MKNKAICILGGMGPDASVYMYKMLNDLAVRDFSAKNNDEYPEIVLCSVPVPDFISSDKNKSKALSMLKKRVDMLNNFEISHAAIACNTAHVLLPELSKKAQFPFISMINEVAVRVSKDSIKKVGLISTPSTLRFKLYHKVLNEVISPTEKEMVLVEKVVRNVLSGKISKSDSKTLSKIADSLVARGAEGIVLGCTETPLVFPKKYKVPVYNCVEILSMALLRKYYNK